SQDTGECTQLSSEDVVSEDSNYEYDFKDPFDNNEDDNNGGYYYNLSSRKKT
ncbi:10810_t:CDS:1, partial [Acaulospora morrowiae]